MKRLIIIALSLWAYTGMAQNISGYWEGMLRISAKDSLRLGMYVVQNGDSISVELDSPDQYSIGAQGSNVTWADSSISWKLNSANASYKGTLTKNGLFEGTFRQGNSKLPLTLERGHERTVINRPQTPEPPYPYTEEEIRIKDKSGKFDLINGTLTLPSGTPKGLVILLTGSGWQNRDEELFAHKPFLVIADHLTRRGYAVFRYDDFPTAVFAKSTTYDFADGVTMILDSFAKRPDLGSLPSGLLGHSEGSLVAEIVAARDKRIDFVITLGGVAQTISDVLLYQVHAINEASGELTPEENNYAVEASKTIYDIIAKSKSPDAAAKKINELYSYRSGTLITSKIEADVFSQNKKAEIMQMVYSPWFYTLFHHQPKKHIKKMRCPMLAVGGEKDLQVDAVTNNALFKAYLPKNPLHRFEVIPNANHLLQTCTTGSPDEYGIIEETLRGDVLEIIQEWLDSAVSQ